MNTEARPSRSALAWDIFCRVIDNHGDLGVCWRLACRLAALGQSVRLWVDDASALHWMAPRGAAGVRVLPWGEPEDDETPGAVVVEAFGCDPPAGFVARMAALQRAPVWINLEYLSAERHALRSHGLPSPQSSGPGAGLTKWFFYPGFTADSGGLMLEDSLASERDSFDAANWLASLDLQAEAEVEVRWVSLFCYAQRALAPALQAPCERPTHWLVTPGPAAAQARAALGCRGEPGEHVTRGATTVHFLPWLTQPGYDHLLWCCDLNHVRGEDSLVRALWAGRPFLWQLYPQTDGAHAAKLEAFLDVYLEGAPLSLAAALRARFRHWNGLADTAGKAPDPVAWRRHALVRREALESSLTAHGDLGSRLCAFAASKR